MYFNNLKEESFKEEFEEDLDKDFELEQEEFELDDKTILEDSYDLYIKNINELKNTDKNEESELFEKIEEINKKINVFLFKDHIEDLLINLDVFKEEKNNSIVTFYDSDDKEERDENFLLSKVNIFKSNLLDLLNKQKETSQDYKNYYENLLKEVKFEFNFLMYSFNQFKINHAEVETTFVNEIKKDLKYLEKTKNRIAQKNLKLVIKIAKNYKANHLEFIDLIQEGNIGLLKGIDKFKHRLGYKLSTYVSWWIKQAINDALTKKSRSIKLPSNIVNVLFKIKKMESEEQISRDKFTPLELSKKLDVSYGKIIKALEAPEDMISMDRVISNEGDKVVFFGDMVTASEQYEPDNELFLSERKSELINIIENNLTDREQIVILRRFGIENGREQTLEEIGNVIGLTRERVRQIEGEALTKLNNNLDLREKFLELTAF